MMKKVGLADVVSMIGLVLLGAGVGMLSIPAMLITLGGILLLLGILGALRK